MKTIEELKPLVTEQVNRLRGLTAEQRELVIEMALAFAWKNPGREPSYEGLANLVRSQGGRQTPNTLVANGGKL